MTIFKNIQLEEIDHTCTNVLFIAASENPDQNEWVATTKTEVEISEKYTHLYTCAGVRYYGKL